MTKKILIADDNYAARIGTGFVLEKNIKNLTIDFAGTYDEIKHKVKAEKYDLLVLEIELHGSIFKSMVKEIKALNENILIFIFSSCNENVALQYLEEGASGFLNKSCDTQALVKAVKTIFKKGYYSENIMNMDAVALTKNKPAEILSERERQVFNLLSQGIGNLEIAIALGIHESTVATFKARVYSKLKITNLVELLGIYKDMSRWG